MSDKKTNEEMVEEVFGEAARESSQDVAHLLHHGIDSLRQRVEDLDIEELRDRYVTACASVAGEYVAILQEHARRQAEAMKSIGGDSPTLH